MATASLVIGIISLVFALVPVVGFFSVPFALAAIGLGVGGLVRARRQQGRGKGMAITGAITGLLALAASVAWFLALAVLGGAASDSHDDWVCGIQLRDLENSVSAFYHDEGHWPADESELVMTFAGQGAPDYDYVAPTAGGQPTYVLAPGSSCPPP